MTKANQTDCQPAFCPLCGTTLAQLSSVRNHLDTVHRVQGRVRNVVYGVVWREVSCAVLGITDPEWEGP